MNKHLHRIVFNAARGMRMVVQETAMSAGKATGATSAVVALAGLLAVSPAPAQIVGAPGVAPNLRPPVLLAPNGVPLVNIQTPSAAGVSRNLFHQFDVQRNGVILNNSRTDVQTQLGGFVQGNPYLATGSARIILNEITSGNPTQLRGYVEVGGQKAEVIIANPAGIAVDGGGFINASRATLTTGTPQFNAAGGLDSFVVRGGTVSIDGAGLDLSRTDYAAILARAVQVNAGLWANELKVVTGANQVSADHGQISPTTGTGATPTFALDVAQLGGMYAGKITLIGTEAGLGARNAGTIQAANGAGTLAGAGQLIVTAAGRLENIGTLQATAGANLSADSLANSGSIASGGELKIATQGTLGNAGGTLEGPRVELASAGGDIDNRGGTIRQTSSVGLTVTGPRLSNTAGGVIGAEPVPETPAEPNPGTSTGGTGTGGTTDPGTPTTGGSGGTDTGSGGGTAPSQAYVPPALGSLTAAGSILNDSGRIYAGGAIALQTPQVNNNGGTLTTTSLAASGPSFSNVGGTLSVANNFSANVERFDNTGGSLRAGSLNIAATGDLINQGGQLESNGDASLSAGGALDNTRGTVSAAGSLTANASGALDNSAGTLLANQGVTLGAQSLNNSKGSIQSATAGTRLTVANQLQNAEGAIGAATDLSVQAGSLSSSGSLRGSHDTTIDAAGALVNDGSITAGRNTTIAAGSLQSNSVLGAGLQADGKFGSIGDLRVTSAGALVATGTQLAAGDAVLQGASIDLSSSITSTTSAANVALTATQGNVTTSGATVVTPGTLSVTANAQPGQTLVNDAGILNAGQLDLRASNIANTNGGEIVQTGAGATTIATSGAIDNTQGRIATNGQDLNLSAASFTNTGGKIEHAGSGILTIADGSYSGANGQITGNGALVVNLAGAFNQNGGSTYAEQITIDAGALSNQGGKIIQGESGNTRITVVGALNNNAGTIASNGNTTVAAGSLSNQGGTIRAAETSNLGLVVGAMLDNSNKGEIGAGGNTTLNAGSLNNDAGRITAVGDLSSTTSGTTSNNKAGTIAANGNTTVNAASLNNNGGTVAAVGGKLQLTTSGATTNAGGSLQAGGATVLSNAGLDNSAGKVFGNSLSVDTHGQALTNVQGTLAATTTVDIQSGALNNDAGLIQSGGAMTVDTHGQALTNTNAAAYAAGQGGITSGDTLTLNTGAVNNTAGFIGAKGALSATASQVTNGNAGQIVGESTLALSTAGFHNRGGSVQSLGDLTIAAGAGTLDNAGSLLRSAATTSLSGASVINSSTSGADQGIEGKNVSITAQAITNSNGAIRADENVTLTSGGQIGNIAGLVSAGDTLTVADLNAVKALSVTNTGGTLVAGKKVALDAGSITWDGKLLSRGDMSLAVTQDISFGTGSETIANNNLSLTTTGDISNSGKLAAGNALTLSGHNIENTVTGDIQGKTTTLVATDTLTNRGVIDGVTTRIEAGTLNNYGTGRIYGDQVSIGVGTLNNEAETVNGVAQAGTIAARNRLDIGAGTINNRNGALIFSAGNLFVGGKLSTDGKAIDTANVLSNHAATIEALGSVDIKTSVLSNTNGGVTWTTQTSPSVHRIEYAIPGSPTRYDPGQLVFAATIGPTVEFEKLQGILWPVFASSTGAIGYAKFGILLPSATYPLPRFKPYYDNPPRNSADLHGQRAVGIDQTESYTEPGVWYSRNDPIWGAFSVIPPETDNPVGDAQTQAYLQAHQRLDVATAAFIKYVFDNLSRAYSYWVYDESTTTPILQTSAPARIISGGAMNIAVGSGTNDMSQIVAGGALSVTGGAIQNKNVEVSGSLNQVGFQGFHPGPSGSEQLASYNISVPTTVTLAAARQEGNTAPVGTGTTLGNAAPGHTNQNVASASGASAAVPTGTGGSAGTAVNAPGAASASGASAAVSPIVQVRLAASSATVQVVRTTSPNASVPTASLFRTHAEPGSRFLVETDPRFANYRNWLSSDYLLDRLALNPDSTQKRLGDGYYEQRLVREQLAQLTGHRYLDGYTSDEAQYQALMDASLTFAQQYHLTPGIALSDAQMAQLTSDIVWLVEQTVTLADGSTQRVLVPQVYVRVKNGDIDGSGALLAGREVDIKLSGDLTNSGTIAGRQVTSLTAENIKNLNGRISGDNVSLSARTDLDNIGGIIDAGSRLEIEAGRDINVRSTIASGSSLNVVPGAVSARSATIVDRVAGLYMSNPDGVLVASAGRDVNLIGAIVANSGKNGTIEIEAGHDINLGTVTVSNQDTAVWGVGNYRADVRTQEIGTRIEGAGDVTLSARNDVNARAATVNSTQGALTAIADRNITIDAGQATAGLDEMRHETKSNTFSSETRTEHFTTSETRAIGSSFGGKTVTLDAGNDIRIRGSNVVSDQGTELWAGSDITIEAATETRNSTTLRQLSQSGVFDSAADLTFGQQEQSSSRQSEGASAAASTVGAISGNVIITAGNRYTQIGSDVIAPGGDIDILARDVQITEARETSRSESQQSFSQSGVTLGIKAPLINTLQSIEDTTRAIGDTKDDRMRALGAASVALSGYSGYQDIARAAAGEGYSGNVSMGASLSIGSSSSESMSTETSDIAAGSRVQAGGNVSITATGGGRESNIHVRGSEISAGNNVNLSADNDITLEAARNTQSQSSTSRSSNSSVGVSYSFGSQNGFTFDAAFGSSRGSDNGTDTGWTSTSISAGNQVNIASGGSTTLRGATVSGYRVNADVGGNLNIQTLQDTSLYHSQSSGSGLSVSICAWLCYGESSASVYAHNMRGEGDYASATEQSGIRAGDGGFNVNVRGNTDLVGGVISSTQTALDRDRNSFSTGSLTMSDVQNHDVFQGSGYSVSLSTSTSGNSAGVGSSDINQNSTTRSGITGIAGNTEVRTGVDSTNGLQMTDRGEALRDVNAQVLTTSQFGSQAARAVGDYATRQHEALMRQAAATTNPEERAALMDEAAKWDEGGTYRVAVHSVIGGLTGGAGGAAGALVSSGSVPYVAATINATEMPDAVRAGLIAAVSTALGATVGGGAPGAAAAFNEVINNCLANTCLSINWDKNAPGYHAYGPIKSPSLCNLSEDGCMEAVKRQLACNSAPGQPECSRPGETSTPMPLTGGSLITQYLSPNGQVVINGTELGQHLFDNGYVMRWISVDDQGSVRILTYGEGVNNDWRGIPGRTMGSMNEVFGVPLFSLIGVDNRLQVQNSLAIRPGR